MSGERLFEYQALTATEKLHGVPRFGATNDFSAIASSDRNERVDYLQGLIFIPCLILSVFVAWALVLFLFKCLGKKRVGFLSGSAFTTPGKRPFYVRLVFCNACIMFIIFTVLLITEGLTQLRSAVATVGTSNEEVLSILTDAKGISVSLQSLGQSSIEIRDALTENLGAFCPGEPDLAAQTGINFDDLASQAIEQINELGNFLKRDVREMQGELDSAIDSSVYLGETVDTIEVNDWESLIFMIPNVILGTCMLIGAMLAWFRQSGPFFTCGLSWIILPIFTLVTAFAFVCSGLLVYAAIINADFCSGGSTNDPDGTFYAVLDRQDLEQESYYYTAIRYYVSQCTTEDPFSIIRDYQVEIETARTIVNDLSASLDSVGISNLSLLCDKDFATYEGLIDSMVRNLGILSENAEDALDLLSCERIVPIYINTVYGGTCTYSVRGVTWTWCALLVIGFMGMLMITFRAAYLPDNTFDADDIKEHDREFAKDYGPQGTYQSEFINDDDEDFVERSDDDDDMSSVYIDGADYAVAYEENSKAPKP